VHAQAQEEKCLALELSAPPSLQHIGLIDAKSNPAAIEGMEDAAEASKLSTLSRAMTGPAQIPLSSILEGRRHPSRQRQPPSISTETKDLGIARSVKAWALR
jgi:hypothetical protein